MIKADNTTNIISKGFLELKSGFALSASFADESFGSNVSSFKSSNNKINPAQQYNESYHRQQDR